MRRTLAMAAALAACVLLDAKVPFSGKVVRSEIARCPEASYLDGMEGKLKWNYTTGLELQSFLDVYRVCGDKALLDYVDRWYDALVSDDGSIGANYKFTNYTLDHVCPARTLFSLYDLTGKEKYRLAMDVIAKQLAWQPRTQEGSFWHKQVYPHQVWLDGLYMAEPFYAEYASRYLEGEQQQLAFEDVVRQFLLAAEHCYDPSTRLYRHAWDASRSMFWCESETGQSAHAWGRAMGWYCMAIVESLPFIPENTPGRDKLVGIFRDIYDVLPDYADPATGMWFQVLDRPQSEGNYVEATASAMFTYAMLKGLRLGYLDRRLKPYARRCWKELLRTFVREDGDNVTLTSCCAVAGLGGKDMRSGKYEYYIGEKIIDNDCKGMGPLVWAALEMERK